MEIPGWKKTLSTLLPPSRHIFEGQNNHPRKIEEKGVWIDAVEVNIWEQDVA